jgi:hypothetical protein
MTTEPLKTESAPEGDPEEMASERPQPPVATHVEVLSSGDPSRRRRRRRRRTAANRDVPQRRIQIFMLCVVIVLLILAVSGFELPKFWRPTGVYVGTPTPSPTSAPSGGSGGFPFHIGKPRLEVVALGVAALLLAYQIPGVEDKVLRVLGLKRDKRR